LFDFGWKFLLGDPAGAEVAGYDVSAWRDVDLPHDWSIEGPYAEHSPGDGGGGYLPGGVGWYRKGFALPAETDDKRVWIEFDGVYKNCAVYVNGEYLGFHPHGYTAFYYDLTPT
jgi:beta-galactosidase